MADWSQAISWMNSGEIVYSEQDGSSVRIDGQGRIVHYDASGAAWCVYYVVPVPWLRRLDWSLEIPASRYFYGAAAALGGESIEVRTGQNISTHHSTRLSLRRSLHREKALRKENEELREQLSTLRKQRDEERARLFAVLP